MQIGLVVAAAVGALIGGGLWYLSTRPILYTRLFVSRDERPLVRREIMDGSHFRSGMRRNGLILVLISGCCLAAAYFVKPL